MLLNVLKSSKIKTSTFSLHSKRLFSEIVPSSESKAATSVLKTPIEILSENSISNLGFTSDEISQAMKTGSDLYLTREKLSTLENAGFYFSDINGVIDLEKNSQKGWKLTYLKNMLLLQDYNSVFRDFLQSCCLFDLEGLKLTCENRFKQYMTTNLRSIVNKGFNVELESLKILQEYKVLKVELFKNLRINRDENKPLSQYEIKVRSTPLGNLVIANEKGNDYSFAKDSKPFILATTMLVRTPMKVGIFSQNLKRKLYGQPEQENIDYVVRFETQVHLSELFWILPTQNKPKRLRSTKITDLNNVMRGNPFFVEKFDMVEDNSRFNYMTKSLELDNNHKRFVKFVGNQNL